MMMTIKRNRKKIKEKTNNNIKKNKKTNNA